MSSARGRRGAGRYAARMTLWTVLIPVAAGLVLAALWWVGKAMLEGAREGQIGRAHV